jgi:hypothetical protein
MSEKLTPYACVVYNCQIVSCGSSKSSHSYLAIFLSSQFQLVMDLSVEDASIGDIM